MLTDIADLSDRCKRCALGVKPPVKSELYTWLASSSPWASTHIGYASSMNNQCFYSSSIASGDGPKFTSTTAAVLDRLFFKFGISEIAITKLV